MTKPYSALKQRARELRQQGYSLRQIERQINIKAGTIARWVKDIAFCGWNDESLAEQHAHHRTKERQQAIAYRQQGWSYSMIQAVIPVSKSTLSLWLRDIVIAHSKPVEQQIQRGQQRSQTTQAQQREQRKAAIHAQATAQIAQLEHLSQRDIFMSGLMLYWAEGGKTHNHVTLANSDPRIIQLFIHWITHCFNIERTQLRVIIHGYPDTDIEQTETYWSSTIGIPRNHFYAFQIDHRTNKNLTKIGKLRYGTCHVNVTGKGTGNLHKHILELIDQFKQQYIAGMA